MTPMMPNAISKSMQYVGRYYVRYFNYRYRRTGTLYEGRFKRQHQLKRGPRSKTQLD